MHNQGPFGKEINIATQVVNGNCPVCTEESIFVSIHKTVFRCTTCGADIEKLKDASREMKYTNGNGGTH